MIQVSDKKDLAMKKFNVVYLHNGIEATFRCLMVSISKLMIMELCSFIIKKSLNVH
jgi:hypothetical protein